MIEFFIGQIAKLTGKSIGEIGEEYLVFADEIFELYEGRLEGEELQKQAMRLFVQGYKAEFAALNSSNTVPVDIFVTGVSNKRDSTFFKRGNCIANYKTNPNATVKRGEVNEYTSTERGILKRSFDFTKGKITEEIVDTIPKNAERIKDEIFVAPRINQKKGFDGKDNPKLGEEYPNHSYQRDVHGIGMIGNDFKKFKLLLRNNNATTKILPIPGKTYNLRVIDMTKEGEKEYSFIDSPTLTTWIESDWNPFESGSLIENFLTQQFMLPYVKKLGDLRAIAEAEFTEKGMNKERNSQGDKSIWEDTKFNACLFVEADLGKMVLKPSGERGLSTVILDDDSVKWDFDKPLESINGWLSDQAVNGLTTGEKSRAVLCCYPKMIKPKDPKRAKSLVVEIYGVIELAKWKTNFNRSKYERINDLNEV